MEFSEYSGIIAVLAASVWAIYLVFFAKERTESTITVGHPHQFRKGDFVAINEQRYEITGVTTTRLVVRKNP